MKNGCGVYYVTQQTDEKSLKNTQFFFHITAVDTTVLLPNLAMF